MRQKPTGERAASRRKTECNRAKAAAAAFKYPFRKNGKRIPKNENTTFQTGKSVVCYWKKSSLGGEDRSMDEKNSRLWSNLILTLVLILDLLLILCWILSRLDLSPIPVNASFLELSAFMMVFIASAVSLLENNLKK